MPHLTSPRCSVLNRTEVLTIWDYQRRTGARMLKFAAWPTNIGYTPNLGACNSGDRHGS